MKYNALALYSALCVVAAGCASGGGGGSHADTTPPPDPTPAPSTFLGIAAGSTGETDAMVAAGYSLDNGAAAYSGWVISDAPDGQVGVEVDSNSKAKKIVVRVPSFTVGESPEIVVQALSDTYTMTPPTGTSLVYEGTGRDVPTSTAYVLDPVAQQWNYQTAALVMLPVTGAVTGSITYAFSGGSATPLAALPATGTATYTGRALGEFVPAEAAATFFIADLSATVNFAGRAMTWATSNVLTGNDVLRNPSSGVPNTALHFIGVPTWSATNPVFGGEITNGAGMTGYVFGRMYGPAAQEIGGTFAADGAAGRVIGAFGGKR